MPAHALGSPPSIITTNAPPTRCGLHHARPLYLSHCNTLHISVARLAAGSFCARGVWRCRSYPAARLPVLASPVTWLLTDHRDRPSWRLSPEASSRCHKPPFTGPAAPSHTSSIYIYIYSYITGSPDLFSHLASETLNCWLCISTSSVNQLHPRRVFLKGESSVNLAGASGRIQPRPEHGLSSGG